MKNEALRTVALDDKYDAPSGLVYLTGTQALVRLPMLQQARDAAAGLDTAGYITGYRGSPLGAYDQALTKAKAQLDRHRITFVPGLNEDLAATALWGTQQVGLFPGAKHDGVFGIWYGKGPGVDRSGDVFRHANQLGTAALGGVIALAGDDHAAKSSTMAAQTDYLFCAVSMPVLAPATLQDYIDLGLHGFAMSRYAGVWVAIKATTDTIETAGVVDVSPDRVQVVVPTDFVMPKGGVNARWPEEPFLKLEERLVRFKVPAAIAYARANRLDRNVFGRPDGEASCLGIVATGKAWLDLMQALADLGIDDAAARRLGVKVWKVAMPWPLEPQGIAAFCAGCDEVLVVEEKRPLVEGQLKDLLYAASVRPRVIGKRDADDRPLLPDYGELSPALLARVVAASLTRLGLSDAIVDVRIAARLAALDTAERGPTKVFASIDRIPYFCSGCPHNTSTRVPEGSRALAGIGCHYMAQWMGRSTDTFTHMGGEGMAWVGQAPFTDTKHVFQNLGDGTYFHSGSLAIRHAVATKTPMTYKILFNDAVAMTGGQTHDGTLTPAAIARQVQAEGVKKVVVVTDDLEKYPAGYFDASVDVFHRSALDDVQRVLRDYADVSVLIYDQTCAAEKRRRRKRGLDGRPGQAGVHQRGGVRRLRRLRREVELRVDRTGRDRIRQEARDQPVVVQQGLLVRRRLLPELRDDRGRQAATRPQGRRRRHRPPRARADVADLRDVLRAPGHRRRRDRRRDDRPVARHGRASRGQGRNGPRHGRARTEERRGDELRALRRIARPPARSADRHRVGGRRHRRRRRGHGQS